MYCNSGIESEYRETINETKVGSLTVFQMKNSSGTIFTGVRDDDWGEVLEPQAHYSDIEVFDDYNIFVKVSCSAGNGNGCSNEKWHMQRGKTKRQFNKKFVYQINYERPEARIQKLNEDVVLISSWGSKSLYSVSRCAEISVTFSRCSDFVGERGKKRASVEIPIPSDWDVFYWNKKPTNYLIGIIDENGDYVGPIININTDKKYKVANNGLEKGLSIKEIINMVTEEEKTKTAELIGKREKMMQRHIPSVPKVEE